MPPRIINAWWSARATRSSRQPFAARVAAASGVIVAALLLSACSSVNAGSASKQDLERAFAEDPAIESMDLRVANDLPWVGGVSGDIIAKEGLDEADLRALIERLAKFSASHKGCSVSVGVIIVSFAVVIIGGLGSIEGAAIGALIVGLARSFAVHVMPEIELFSIYIVMALVLIVRPEGLFQRIQARKI